MNLQDTLDTIIEAAKQAKVALADENEGEFTNLVNIIHTDANKVFDLVQGW